jgi:ribonucleoside-diphosphate reductase alpha chain
MQSKPLTTTVSIHKNNEVIPFRSTPLANMGSHGIRVIRRDGSTTSLNIGKIRDVVEWSLSRQKSQFNRLRSGFNHAPAGWDYHQGNTG